MTDYQQPELLRLMSEEESAAIPAMEEDEPTDAAPTLTVAELAELARAQGKGKLAFASALECLPIDVGQRIETMSDSDRYALAKSMGMLADAPSTEEEVRFKDRVTQAPLFGADEEFRAWQSWKGMPEFSHQDLDPYASVLVHFANKDDMAAFAKLIGQRISGTQRKTQSL